MSKDEQRLDDDIDTSEATYFLGGHIIEMAERVRIVHQAEPGAIATYSFEMDGETYAVTLRVADKNGAGK